MWFASSTKGVNPSINALVTGQVQMVFATAGLGTAVSKVEPPESAILQKPRAAMHSLIVSINHSVAAIATSSAFGFTTV